MDTVTYYDNSVYSYQTPPATSTAISDDFLISSSMVKDYGYLSSIEVYGHVNGTITLNVSFIIYNENFLFVFIKIFSVLRLSRHLDAHFPII